MRPPVSESMRAYATQLPPISDESFGSYFDFLSSSRIVLLGDASHGTSEFYHARAEITKYLVEHHGFDTICLEADWPDAESLDRYVRQRPGPNTELQADEREDAPFKRFPTWMWRNKEMQDLVHWLRDHNATLPKTQRSGIFGLDLYSMGASLAAVTKYLERVDPELAEKARRRYGCLEPWIEEPHDYGRESLRSSFRSCEKNVIAMLRELLRHRLGYSSLQNDGEEFHSAEQNARLVADAEQYYRAMYYDDDQGWNKRDTHMFETLTRLMKFRGGKAIVWAHDSHLGDARFTGMAKRGELNLGQLCRENFESDVTIVGCSTHTGTVAAAHHWDGNMKIMNVRPSREDSWERVAHDTDIPRFVLDMRKIDKDLKTELAQRRLFRYIGVIYRPDTERWSHYSSADLSNQFDVLLWFDETKAVQSLEVKQPKTPLALGETYPFGL